MEKKDSNLVLVAAVGALACLGLVGGLFALAPLSFDEMLRAQPPAAPAVAVEPNPELDAGPSDPHDGHELARPGGPEDGQGTVAVDRFAANAEELGHGSTDRGRVGGGMRGRIADIRLQTFAPDVRGGLRPEVVRRGVHRHLTEVRSCYEAALLVDPAIEGRFVMRFAVQPNGTVSSVATTDSTFSAPNVEDCVVAQVRSWTFPEPDGGGVVLVSYPFILSTPD